MEPALHSLQKEARQPDREAYFKTSDGLRLFYRVGGNLKGPPVLFCYGLVCSAFHFKYQWEHLAQTHRLLMLDYRGHHISEYPKAITTLTFARIADDLAEFLAHEKIDEPVTAIGHSMGVNIVIELCARHPELVSSLVLISGATTFPARDTVELKRLLAAQSFLKIVDGLFPKFADKLWRFQAAVPGVERFAGFLGFNPRLAKAEDIRGVIEKMSGFTPNIFFQLVGEYIRHDRTELLGEIALPTLVVGGDKDKMVPWPLQLKLHARMRAAELVRIREGSHVPQFDRPHEVNEALSRFLRSLQTSGAR